MSDGVAVVDEVVAVHRRTQVAKHLRRSPVALVALGLSLMFVGAAVFAEQVTPYDPFATVADPLTAPDGDHLMGTDDLGRDVFSGVVAGARTSMAIAVSVTLLTIVIGVAVGLVAGFRGGIVDHVLMRLTEIFQALPRFFLAVVVLAVYGTGVEKVILVLGLTSWPTLARIVRAETLSVREREFVDAARALGAREARIIRCHVLPNIATAVVVVALLTGGSAILMEAGLGFLGLTDPQAMSWGYLVNNAQEFLRVAWWMAAFPGGAIALVVLALNLLSDAIGDALSPHARV